MDSKGRPLAPEKPLWFSNIPLVASSYGSVAPAAADGPPAAPTPRPAHRCSWSRSTTEDRDVLELERARKKLGLTCEHKNQRGGLLGWLKGGKASK
jgi:hypothetical protein